MNKKNLLILVCVLLFFVVIGNVFHYKTVFKQNYKLGHFDSKTQAPVVLYQSETTPEDSLNPDIIKNFDISFDFKINNIKEFDNIFQTADVNNGIRMELDKNGNAVILIKTNKEPYYYGIPLTRFEKDTWYKIRLYQKDTKLNIYINDDLLSKHSIQNSFSVNSIIVGQGLDYTRKFNGEIKNFKYTYSVKKKYDGIYKIGNTCLYITLLILIYFAGIKLKEDFDNKNKFSLQNLSYLLLLNLYPILFEYLKNINELFFVEFISFTIISSAIISLLYLSLFKFIKPHKLFLIISTAILFFYFSGHIYNNFFQFIKPVEYIRILIFIFILILLTIINIKNNIEQSLKTPKFIILILISLCFISNINMVLSHLKIIHNNNKNNPKSNIETIVKKHNTQKNPNIYFIIFDEYINSKVSKEYFNHDNSKFINFLKEQDFYVADYSMSNYGHTMFSIPSMLNFDYYQNLGLKESENHAKIFAQLSNLYYNNKLISYISKSHKIFYINLENAIGDFKNVYKKYGIPKGKSEFSLKNIIIENSILFWNKNDYGLGHRKIVLNSLDALYDSIEDKTENKFVFMHIICPHAPYVFDENGNFPKKLNERKDNIVSLNGSKFIRVNQKSYFKQLEYLNTKIIEITKKIKTYDEDAVIIYISDHGFIPIKDYPTNLPSNFSLDNEYYIRAANLVAVYFPDKDYSDLYETITPVNLIRILLNRYFDAKLPLIEDKHYFLDTYVRYNPIDATEIVRKSFSPNK